MLSLRIPGRGEINAEDLPLLAPRIDRCSWLVLPQARWATGCDRLFLVVVGEEPNACRLRREFIAGQDAEFGEPPQRISSRRVILASPLPGIAISQEFVNERRRSVRVSHTHPGFKARFDG